MGHKHTEESKEKLRQAALKQWQNPEHRRHFSEVRKGHPVSEETREKLRKAKTGVPQSPEAIRKKTETMLAKPSTMVICKNCGIEFEARRSTRRFCSANCSKLFAQQNSPPNVVCGVCGKPFYVHSCRLKRSKRFYCSYECMGQGYRSENYNPRDSNAIKRWREQVKKRDGYRCRMCAAEKPLVGHHILPYQYFPELICDLDNGITLCRKHHNKIHKMIDSLMVSIVRQQKEWLRNEILKEVSKCT